MSAHDTPDGSSAYGSGEMFDRIADRYDLINRIMTLGMDLRWRRRLVASVLPQRHDPAAIEILDVASGTADVALAISRTDERASVVGLDPSARMLRRGREKVDEAGLARRVQLIAGDAQALPFADDRFDGACIAFGIRNVPDRARGLAEMRRVTRPGGAVAVLELSEPNSGWAAPMARWYVHNVVPTVGGWLSGDREYRYLQRSIAAFPAPEDFARMMGEAGLHDVSFARMSFGAAHLYTGRA